MLCFSDVGSCESLFEVNWTCRSMSFSEDRGGGRIHVIVITSVSKKMILANIALLKVCVSSSPLSDDKSIIFFFDTDCRLV